MHHVLPTALRVISLALEKSYNYTGVSEATLNYLGNMNSINSLGNNNKTQQSKVQ